MSTTLTSQLAEHLGSRAGRLETRSNVEAVLKKHLKAGREAWPGVHLTEGEFLRHLAGHLGADPAAALATLHAKDLYLAAACAKGDSKALAAFERSFFPEVTEALARLDGAFSLKDDVKQILRERLFVAPPGGRAKIADYAGRGPLAGWACAAAMKTALSLKRQQRKEVPLEETPVFEQVTTDPELDFIKSVHQKDFKEALREAFGVLTARERTVMRLHLIDGLNIDEIGTLYRAHRSTVARWIQRTRQTLFEQTRKILMSRLRLRNSELDSLLRLLHSQLDASISRYLRSKASKP